MRATTLKKIGYALIFAQLIAIQIDELDFQACAVLNHRHPLSTQIPKRLTWEAQRQVVLKRTDSQSLGKILGVGTVIGGLEVGLTVGAWIRKAKQPTALFKDICQAIPVVGGFDHGNVIEILTVRQKHFDEIVESVTDAHPTAPDIFPTSSPALLRAFRRTQMTALSLCKSMATKFFCGTEIFSVRCTPQVSFLLVQKMEILWDLVGLRSFCCVALFLWWFPAVSKLSNSLYAEKLTSVSKSEIGYEFRARLTIAYNRRMQGNCTLITWSEATLKNYYVAAVLLYLALAHFNREQEALAESECPIF